MGIGLNSVNSPIIVPKKEKKSDVISGTIGAGISTGIICGGLGYLGEKTYVEGLNECLKPALKKLKNDNIVYVTHEGYIHSFTKKGNKILADVYKKGQERFSLKFSTTVGNAFKVNWKRIVAGGGIFAGLGVAIYLVYRGIKELCTKNN